MDACDLPAAGRCRAAWVRQRRAVDGVAPFQTGYAVQAHEDQQRQSEVVRGFPQREPPSTCASDGLLRKGQ